MQAQGTGPDYYEREGQTYGSRRRPDPRLAAVIEEALGAARSIVNVGAGPGSYEPHGRDVVAVEPSLVMLAQRTSSAPKVRAVAEHLPFRDGAFDAALASLTIHHWSDWRAGVAEMQRLAPRVVVFTFDAELDPPFWLFDYFPAILTADRIRMPPVAALCSALGARAVPVPVPHDCIDGFLGAYWRSPEAYLDPTVRAPMSGFTLPAAAELEAGLARLQADLSTGSWRDRYGRLLAEESIDIGYRLVISG